MAKTSKASLEEARRNFLHAQWRASLARGWDWRHLSSARALEVVAGLCLCLLYLAGTTAYGLHAEWRLRGVLLVPFGGVGLLLLLGWLRHRRPLRRVSGLAFAEAPEVLEARRRYFELFLGGTLAEEDLAKFQPGSPLYGTVVEVPVTAAFGVVKHCRLSFDWYRGSFHLESVAQ